MRLERITNHSFHIMDAGAFLGSFHSPKRTNSKKWKFQPSEHYLTEYQMDEIRKHLKKINSAGT